MPGVLRILIFLLLPLLACTTACGVLVVTLLLTQPTLPSKSRTLYQEPEVWVTSRGKPWPIFHSTSYLVPGPERILTFSPRMETISAKAAVWERKKAERKTPQKSGRFRFIATPQFVYVLFALHQTHKHGAQRRMHTRRKTCPHPVREPALIAQVYACWYDQHLSFVLGSP